MKYDDFKIFKFSTISKKLNRARDNLPRIYKYINLTRCKHILVNVVDFFILIIKSIFSEIYKRINFRKYNFYRVYKHLDLRRYNFYRVYKYLDLRRYNFYRVYKYLDLRRYNFYRVYKYFNIKRYKYVPAYIAGVVVFSFFIYLNIPLFFSYDKSKLENVICKDPNIKCTIQGKVRYSFFPSPRIKIKNLIVQDFIDKKKTLGKFEDIAIKLSFYDLSNRNKLNFTKINLRNGEINFNLNKVKKYKNFFNKKFYSMPINLKKGKIEFFDDKKSIGIIRDINFKYKTSKKVDSVILKGNFLSDNIYINLKNKKDEKKKSKFLILKFLDIDAKIDIFDSDLDENTISGNISFRKNKSRLTSNFDYKEDQITFKWANFRNDFLDGKLNGEVKFLPYFNFNLNADLNGINFNKLYSSIIMLDEKRKKNLFKFNEKINGQLNLSANKIFSKRTLIHSFESRIEFINGNILIEQLLLNLGKLGAADVTGVIKNNNKFSKFKFENNIYFDNLKRFYNKFGIFNKQKISSNIFISGIFDLTKLQLRLHEIYDDKKFKEEDVAYIENEFNDIVLEDGYESLFDFGRIKEFIKSIAVEKN